MLGASRRFGGYAVGTLLLWGALATIFPNIFVVRSDSTSLYRTMAAYFWNPNLLWVAFALSALWLIVSVMGIQERLADLGRAPHPDESASPVVLGSVADGRAILRAGGKIVEFDSWAMEVFEAQGQAARDTIDRTIRASRKTKFSKFDLTQILAGQVPDEESVHPVETGFLGMPRRIRFWTRSEIKALDPGERAQLLDLNSTLASWYAGHTWSEALSLLRDGLDVLKAQIEPPEQQPASVGLADLRLSVLGQGAMGVTPPDSRLRNWYEKVGSHLGG